LEVINGEYLGHTGCPKHGSSDSLALYKKPNGSVDGHCWSECGHLSNKELNTLGVLNGNKVVVDFTTKSGGTFVMTEEVKAKVESVLEHDISGWKERRIPRVVSEFYNVRTKMVDGEVRYRYYPSTQNDELVGWHVRDDFVKKAKNAGEEIDRPPFFPIGKVKSDCQLFGQSRFEKGGKYLVLASGEEDAQAIFTALNLEKVGGKLAIKKFLTPVVSTTTGEGSIGQIKSNYEYITSFENVIIMYDNDKAGREGAEKVAKMLKAGQARIAKYKRKDACEHSKHEEFDQIAQAFWKAERYSPVDVLHLHDMWHDFENEDSNAVIPFPRSMSKLNEMMNGGHRRGEVTVIGALTSIGKSTFINSIVYDLIENTPYKVGAFFLEGTKREVVRDLLSLDLGINLRRADRSSLDMNKLKRHFIDNLASKDKFVYVDHQGSISNNEIFDKFNYLAEVEGCDVIIFDVLQAGCNSSDNGAIIEFMDAILKFAKKTDTSIIVVSHMRKPTGDDPHNVSEYDLMGSSSINQIAFNTILISRDKMSQDPKIRNSTQIKLVKCRDSGNTGIAGWVRFDPDSSHLFACADPYEGLTQEEASDLGLMTDDSDYEES